MTAVSTTLVRTGDHQTYSAAEEPYRENAGQPGIYAHRARSGFTVYWHITAGKHGRTLAKGTTWTLGGALTKATAAAHKPSLRTGGAA